LLIFKRSHFIQRVYDHAHEDIDCLGGANQSLNRVGCVFKDNTGRFEEAMESLVVDGTEWRCDPYKVILTTYMVPFCAFAAATYHTRRSPRSVGRFHEPPTEK